MSTNATSSPAVRVASVAELRDLITAHGNVSPEYATKMFHPVPDLPTVKDRAGYLVAKATGRIVLDVGCVGQISANIKAVAKAYYGIDKANGNGWATVDVDHAPHEMPVYPDVDLIIASELLEHLANPGYFLAMLRDKYPGIPVYITVPCACGYQVRNDCEVVNKDHVAWYSYTTLNTLLTRYGYAIQEARWYNGQPHKAEGLIALVK